MLLRSITQHVKDQNWFAVALDFLIVVVGILIAFQITNWNEARTERLNEAHYLERLDTEFDVIRTRLIDGKRIFGSSVRNINLLLKAHREYAANPDGNLPDDDVLGPALAEITSGRIPAGSPAAFKEMISSGALQTLTSEDLRQALFAYDEFAAIAREGWRTIRDEQHASANRLFSLLDLAASGLSGDKDVGGLSGLEIIRFDRQTFLENTEMRGALSILLIAQINQYSLLEQQLQLAEEIESLIAQEHQ